MFNHLRVRIAATRTAPPPKHDDHDDVQLLVADGPGDDLAREYWIGDRVRIISDPPEETWTRYIGAVVSKRSIDGTSAHEYGVLFDDEHETVLHFWTSQLEAAPEERGGIEPAGDDDGWVPLSVREAARAERRRWEDLYLGACELLREVTADRDRLDAVNGRLLAELRAFEVEPAVRE